MLAGWSNDDNFSIRVQDKIVQEEAIENITDVFSSRDYIIFFENSIAKVVRRDLITLHGIQLLPKTIELPLTNLSYFLMIP